MKIVFNTSPLIFLARLEMLEAFLAKMGEYYAPQAVCDEILAKEDKASRLLKEIFISQTIIIQGVQMTKLAHSLQNRLGRGESEALALALEMQADYVILDDFAARREAIRLGLQVKGTLAIVRKLRQDGQIRINDLALFYAQLMSIGFRIKRSLFDQIFDE